MNITLNRPLTLTYQKRSSCVGLVLNHSCFWRDYTQHITNNLHGVHVVCGNILIILFLLCWIRIKSGRVLVLVCIVLSCCHSTKFCSFVLMCHKGTKVCQDSILVVLLCHSSCLCCHPCCQRSFLLALVVVFIVCIPNTVIVINVVPYCAN